MNTENYRFVDVIFTDGKIAEICETRNTLGIMMRINPQMGEGQHSH
jgi:hypothetical protein